MIAKIQLTLPMHENRGLNVSVFDSSAVGRGSQPRSGQYKDYDIGMVDVLLGTLH